jgi:hypothetical protein
MNNVEKLTFTTDNLNEADSVDFQLKTGKKSVLISLQVSEPSWVRIYKSSEQRSMDQRPGPGGTLSSFLGIGGHPCSENVTTLETEVISQNPLPLLEGDSEGLTYVRLVKRNKGSKEVTLTATTCPLPV